MSALGFACVDIIVVLTVINTLLIHFVLDDLWVAVVQPAGVNVTWGTWFFGLDADNFILDNIGVVEVVEGVGIS